MKHFYNGTIRRMRSYTDAIRFYTVTASAGENGSISPLGESIVKRGGSVIYTLDPGTNYYVNGILLDGVLVPWDEVEYTLSDIRSDHTLVAQFAYGIPGYTITVTQPDNGAINYSIDGDLIIFTIVPYEGYQVGDVIVNGVSVGAVENYVIDTTEDPAGAYAISAVIVVAVDLNTVSLLHFDLDENSVQQLGTGTVDSVYYDEYMGSQITVVGDGVPVPIPGTPSGIGIRFTSGALSGQTFNASAADDGTQYEWVDTVTVDGDASAAVSGDTFVVEQFNATHITDDTGKTWTAGAGAQIRGFSAKFGNGSLTGPRYSYVTTNDYTGFNVGTGDFTVEAWTQGPSGSLFQRGYDFAIKGDARGWIMLVLPGYQQHWSVACIAQSPEWTHIAVVRSGGTVTMYANGQPVEFMDGGYSLSYPYDLSFSSSAGVVCEEDGRISLDEWRFSNIARYTEPFTPPTGPFEV